MLLREDLIYTNYKKQRPPEESSDYPRGKPKPPAFAKIMLRFLS